MNGYTKLFSSILDSTIWQEDLATKVLWVTMLAMSDYEGIVEGSIPGLARRAGISVDECEKSLAKLYAPDRYSRTPDYEGRRVEAIDGGWLILNRAKYRDRGWEDDRVKRHREANRRYYSRLKASDNSDPNSDRQYPKVSESDRVGDKKEKEKEKEKEKKEETKEKAFSPEGQPAINLAKGLAEYLDLVVTQSFLLDIEAALKCAAKRENLSLARACDYLMQVATKARERGTKVNQFWFRDADGWEPHDNYKTAAQLRNERSASAIERAFAEDAGPEDLPRNIR